MNRKAEFKQRTNTKNNNNDEKTCTNKNGERQVEENALYSCRRLSQGGHTEKNLTRTEKRCRTSVEYKSEIGHRGTGRIIVVGGGGQRPGKRTQTRTRIKTIERRQQLAKNT